jgi:hypothetical protein
MASINGVHQWCPLMTWICHLTYARRISNVGISFTQTQTHTQTHRHTDPQTHRPTDTQTHRHTDTQTHRHTDTQTHRHTDTQTHRQLIFFLSGFSSLIFPL